MPILFQGTAGAPRQVAEAVPETVGPSNLYGFAQMTITSQRRCCDRQGRARRQDSAEYRDQSRFAHYTRQWRIPRRHFYAPVAAGGSGDPGWWRRERRYGSLNVSQPTLRHEPRDLIQNQTDATSKFNTSFIEHTLVTGVEIGEETSDPRRFSTISPVQHDAADQSNSGQPYNASTFTFPTPRPTRQRRRFMPFDTAD